MLSDLRESGALEGWAREVLDAHPEEADRLRSGEEKLVGFFMGELMRASRGQADPGLARALLIAIARGEALE